VDLLLLLLARSFSSVANNKLRQKRALRSTPKLDSISSVSDGRSVVSVVGNLVAASVCVCVCVWYIPGRWGDRVCRAHMRRVT